MRSAHILAYMTQSQYNQWLVRLYRSLEEANLLDHLGFDHLGKFRENYSQHFWETFYSDLTHLIPLLRETEEGKMLLATLYSRMSWRRYNSELLWFPKTDYIILNCALPSFLFQRQNCGINWWWRNRYLNAGVKWVPALLKTSIYLLFSPFS